MRSKRWLLPAVVCALTTAGPLVAQTDWTRAMVLDGREGHALASDTGRGRVVLFAGQLDSQLDFDDLWEWDGGD